MTKRLRAHKLVYYRTSKGTKRLKVHKGIFYARDIGVLKYLVWLAGCPFGDLVEAREMGIDFTVPMMSPQ